MIKSLLPILFAAIVFTPSGYADDRMPKVIILMADDFNPALNGYGHPQCKASRLEAKRLTAGYDRKRYQ